MKVFVSEYQTFNLERMGVPFAVALASGETKPTPFSTCGEAVSLPTSQWGALPSKAASIL